MNHKGTEGAEEKARSKREEERRKKEEGRSDEPQRHRGRRGKGKKQEGRRCHTISGNKKCASSRAMVAQAD